MTQIKICGLMRSHDVELCGNLGVDMAGFVVDYPVSVPWNLGKEEVTPLLRQAACFMKTCVVTGGEKEMILELAKSLRPDFVQLHYKESLADTVFLAQRLESLGIQLIKTLPLSEKERESQFDAAEVESCVKALNESGVSLILTDSREPDNAAAPGCGMDRDFFHKVRKYAALPVMLAGGIVPENVRKLIKSEQPEWIDLMTGVESEPGKKDKAKLIHLMEEVDAAQNEIRLSEKRVDKAANIW